MVPAERKVRRTRTPNCGGFFRQSESRPWLARHTIFQQTEPTLRRPKQSLGDPGRPEVMEERKEQVESERTESMTESRAELRTEKMNSLEA